MAANTDELCSPIEPLKQWPTRIGFLVITGLLATITMDAVAVTLIKSGIIRLGRYQSGPQLLGRWIGSFPAGRFFHSTILETPPVPYEAVIGIMSHYSIGIILTSLLLGPYLLIWHRKVTLRTALLYGIATCVFSYFVMFPAMGFGVMGSKTPVTIMLTAFSACNHAAFGVGIYVWSNLLRKLFP